MVERSFQTRPASKYLLPRNESIRGRVMYSTLHGNNVTLLFRTPCSENCDKGARYTDLCSQWNDAKLEFVTE